MKTIKMLVLVLVTVAGSAWAADFSGLPALRSSGIVSVVEADPPMPGPAETSRQEPVEADPLAALNAEIESILLTTIDLDARMWALRIQAGEFSLETLKGKSARWIFPEDYKASLFVKIEALLRAGSVAPLTKEEHAALNTTHERVVRLLADRSEKLRIEAARISLPTIDLEARMWALRIQAGEFSAEALKGESAGWIISEEYKASLFVKIEALLRAGSAAPLTKAEHAALKAAKEKVRQLFQRRAR